MYTFLIHITMSLFDGWLMRPFLATRLQFIMSDQIIKALIAGKINAFLLPCCSFFDEWFEGAAVLLCAWIHITQSRPITSLRRIQQIVLMDLKRLWESWACWTGRGRAESATAFTFETTTLSIAHVTFPLISKLLLVQFCCTCFCEYIRAC